MPKRKKINMPIMEERGETASPFIVDLKKQLWEAEEEQALKKEKFKFKPLFKKEDFKNYYLKIKENSKKEVNLDRKKIIKTVSAIIKNAKPLAVQDETRQNIRAMYLFYNSFKVSKDWFAIYGDKIRRLMFFSLLEFVFSFLKITWKFLYKLFYITGWLTLFIIRFFYFAGARMLNSAGELFKRLFRAVVPGLVFLKNYLLKAVGFGRKILKYPVANFKLIKRRRESAVVEKETNEERNIEDEYFHEEEIKENAWPAGQRLSLRPILVFAAILVLLVVPIKLISYFQTFNLSDLRGKVLGVSEEAINNLKIAGEEASEFNFNKAEENFSQAAQNFLSAKEELAGVSDALLSIASVIPSVLPDSETADNIRLAGASKEILKAGELASRMGGNLSLAAGSLFNGFNSGRKAEDILADFIKYGEEAAVNANELAGIFKTIDSGDIPEPYRQSFQSVSGKGELILKNLNELVDIAKKLELFLAINQYKRYLLVFQNNAEMRAPGGFIGSYALVDFQNGEIKNIEAPGGGSYDTEAGLKERIIAPAPLRLVNPLWHFWDANWWPNWPTSARKLAWFYEKSDGPTVDGVISFTPTAVEEMLKVLGPIDMSEKYGAVVTSENFWQVTQEFSEQKPDATKEPKKIIGDLIAKIMEEMPKRMNKENIVSLIKAFEKSLNEKHILFYFIDGQLQERVGEYGWDGAIKHTEWDYLSVINTNIAGGKSDRKIKQTISHIARVSESGLIVDSVKIKREHTAVKYEQFSGVRNVNWLRVYVPLGSKLIEARGFEKPADIYFEKPDESWDYDQDLANAEKYAEIHEESGTLIYEEAGKTVFANWTMVDPGETDEIYLKYELPFKLEEKEAYTFKEIISELLNPAQKETHAYALLAQKQPGSYNSEIESDLILPDSMNLIWSYPSAGGITAKGWSAASDLNTDKFWAGIIER